ncbi:hypothetical protein B0J18DRAFT_388589 [Chaetomium sp. MPI-SDFR-AT-0129]|nr:hypothetical protein B0J18DRAFT_388589 [Chaetomium sp. MPI-SDFR-AT-0129]
MSYKMPASEPMAIVGSSCRFAGGVTSPSRLWELLKDPVDLTQDVPVERFNIKAFYHADGEYHGTTNSPKAYFLDQDHRVFDASFFNISPKEAEAIDPQQRMLLEVVYEALESAGYTLQQYAGDKVAVYAGLMTSDYDTLSQRDELDTSQYYATGNARSILSNRISYFFNFRGPSMTIDTACSSSLVALHQAVLSLRAGECKMACVAGANLILTPEQFIVESNLHMLSPTGHCRMWDAGADGYARGEGVAAMFIKSLSQAIADGDHIEAVIRETGVNSDGRSRGITMPNWQAQSQLLRDTYQRAGLDIDKPEDRCQYFEAHGTGTSAGDPNEARAIEDAFFGRNKDVKDQHKLLVGSVKTVIGHTEGAAGLAGLLKMVQSMKHNAVMPNLHLDTLSPAVAPFCTHLTVPTALTPWPAVVTGQPKRGSVNSFGFGGTNAHVIVEEYVPELHNPAGAERGQKGVELIGLVPGSNAGLVDYGMWPTEAMALCLPLVLSAPSPKALVAVAQSYLDYLVKNPPTNISELAWHTYKRRTAFPFRMAVSAMSVPGLKTKLKSELSKAGASSNNLTNHNGIGANISTRVRQGDTPPKILGIFTGQGAQWPTMARALFISCPAFASVIHSLDGILQHCPDPPEWLLAGQILADPADSQLDKASVAQPVCTAIQLALVKVLTEILGMRFRAVVGHSSGEIAAAYAAGRIGIAEAMLIAHYRGMGVHLAQGEPNENNDGQAKGGMLAAGLTWREAKNFCSQSRFKGRLWVAASNAPGSVTLSGHRNAVSQAMQVLTTQGKFARALRVDTAYHSPLMDAAADAYVEVLRKCEITPTDGNGTTVWVSSVGKNHPPSDEDLTAVYWRDNMVQPVMFAEAVGAAVDSLGPFDCAVEVGPHPALMGPVSQVLAAKNVSGMPYLGIFDRKLDDREAFAGFLGKMWTLFGSSAHQIEEFVKAHGVEGLDKTNARVLDFPTYPWDHTQAFYRESRLSKQYHFKTDAPHELLGVRTRDDDGKHQLRWRNLLKADRLPWVQHHKFQGQALLPASAYLVMALDAAKALLGKRAASTVELCDLKFPAGIILEGNVPVEVLFTLTVEEEDAEMIKASMLLTSARADSSDTSGKATTAAMKKNFTGSMIITLGPPTPDALPFPTLVATRPETRPADPAAFYDMMRKDTGLEYTGPFRALQSLDRRHEFATATVRRHDDELDTTTLKLSPAMLDGCLQTAFVTVSAPGDGEIWTAFLPVSMEKVVFNLDQEDSIWDDDGMLVVDAYLTKATPASKHTPASFTADIEIFQPSIGYLEIQVIGLTVGSFGATTTSDNVWELYLTTRFDVDPDDEIVLPGPECTNPATMGLLIDSCERVAGFYTEYGLSSWPKETQAEIDAFIASSPYFVTLETIRAFGLYMPLLITDAVTLLTRDGQELLGLQRHVARVVRQIAHKYPAMNVLGVTDPTLGLTSHVMEGLDGSFASVRVGGEVERYLEKRAVWWETDKERVKVDRVILEKKEEYKGVVYDLVVLTTADMVNPVTVLKSVKRMMRPGGFLVLVHETKMKPQPFHNWPALLDHFGFGFFMKNSHQGLQSLRKYGITVRQAEARDKHTLLLPLGINTKKKPQPLTDRLVIVGGTSMPTAILAAGVCERLSVLSGSDANTGRRAKPKASAITAAIFLQDLEEPIISQATDDRLAVLRALFRPDMVILWVVRNARYNNPEHAASLGFARTILAEIPGLTLKMVDLQVQGGISVEGSATVVAEMFARLLKQNTVGETELWSNEPEVHVDRGKLLVPRVMPWEEANKRVNAPRKEFLTFWNSVEHLIRVVPNRDDAAPEKFGLEGLFRSPNTLIIDMSDGRSVLSDMLKRHAPRGSRYMTHGSLMNSHLGKDDREENRYDELARFWSFSNSLAVITIRGIAAPTGHRAIVTVPDLVKRTTPLPPFSFIHWAKERISLVTLFVKLGARIFVLCSRNPPSTMPAWGQQLRSKGIYIHFACLNVISLHDVHNLRVHLTQTMKLPPIGGVVNGAMVLEDCVFSHLTAETLKRVLLPKTVGSVNLNRVFCEPDMDFFIMTSSFAAIGGHAGQSNYAAANMFMNGLAAGRRKRGLCATAINIGVIYGLGFLNREKEELYKGLEREGYPAISERDLHHMFVEAIVAGRPSNTDQGEQGIYDIVTGLRRFEAGRPTLHWHRDPRFGHFVTYNTSDDTTNPTSGTKIPIKQRIADPSHTQASLTTLLTEAFVTQLTTQLHLGSSSGAVTPEHSLTELGADSLAAVDLRNWAWRVLGLDVAVMKVLGAATVKGLCEELAEGVLKKREQSQSQGE